MDIDPASQQALLFNETAAGHLLDAAGGVVQEPGRDRRHEGPLPAAAGPAVAGGDGHVARHVPAHLWPCMQIINGPVLERPRSSLPTAARHPYPCLYI